MIEKVQQFLTTINADTSVMARMDKCIEENEELLHAFFSKHPGDLLSEAADRIITGYALLLSLGGTEQTVEDKMAEVMAREEYREAANGR